MDRVSVVPFTVEDRAELLDTIKALQARLNVAETEAYRRGLADAQREVDRIAANPKDFTDRVRKGAGMCSAAIRRLIQEAQRG